MKSHKLAAPLLLATSFVAHDASADSTIQTPGDHPSYKVELEPHLLLGWADVYASSGVGIGGRASIPIVDNGFVKTINNSVAVSFGVDFLHYDGCGYVNRGCGANFLFFPVTIQWNFYVHHEWSVFGEPGLYIWHGFFDNDYCAGFKDCRSFQSDGIRPALYLGGRYHFSDKVALTMRLGYPTISVGVSFM